MAFNIKNIFGGKNKDKGGKENSEEQKAISNEPSLSFGSNSDSSPMQQLGAIAEGQNNFIQKTLAGEAAQEDIVRIVETNNYARARRVKTPGVKKEETTRREWMEKGIADALKYNQQEAAERVARDMGKSVNKPTVSKKGEKGEEGSNPKIDILELL